jgi:hypothetical protein
MEASSDTRVIEYKNERQFRVDAVRLLGREGWAVVAIEQREQRVGGLRALLPRKPGPRFVVTYKRLGSGPPPETQTEEGSMDPPPST